MAFFKFRAHGQKGDDQQASPAETIDDMRRRARHRLIGATVLVAIGVLGFPMLFDTQPRPVQVDIPIDIPDRDKARPIGAAAAGKVAAAAPEQGGAPATTPATPTPPAAAATPDRVPAGSSLDAKESVVADKPVRTAAPAKEDKPAPVKSDVKPVPPEAKAPTLAAEDGAKARALLEGKDATAAGQPRFVVQVGAFADADKAQEARMRVERAGLKTYTQVVDTKDGKRIRVRIGPYAERAEADKVAGRIKSLSLPASILSL